MSRYPGCAPVTGAAFTAANIAQMIPQQLAQRHHLLEHLGTASNLEPPTITDCGIHAGEYRQLHRSALTLTAEERDACARVVANRWGDAAAAEHYNAPCPACQDFAHYYDRR